MPLVVQIPGCTVSFLVSPGHKSLDHLLLCAAMEKFPNGMNEVHKD